MLGRRLPAAGPRGVGGSVGCCKGTVSREATLAAMLGCSRLRCWAIKTGLGSRPARPVPAVGMQGGICSSGCVG